MSSDWNDLLNRAYAKSFRLQYNDSQDEIFDLFKIVYRMKQDFDQLQDRMVAAETVNRISLTMIEDITIAFEIEGIDIQERLNNAADIFTGNLDDMADDKAARVEIISHFIRTSYKGESKPDADQKIGLRIIQGGKPSDELV